MEVESPVEAGDSFDFNLLPSKGQINLCPPLHGKNSIRQDWYIPQVELQEIALWRPSLMDIQ